MEKIKLPRIVTHLNGGIEQALLQIAEEEGCLSENDRKRLEYLKEQPQNRVELNGEIWTPKTSSNAPTT